MLALAVQWILLGGVLVVAVFLFVGFPLAVFFSALLERRSIKPLAPIDTSYELTPTGYEAEYIAAAQASGFRRLGQFTDGDNALQEGTYTLMLPDDGRTLLLLRHGRFARRIILISQFEGSRWLITCNVSGARDISGLDDEQMYPDASFEVLRSFHEERLTKRREMSIPFSPETVAADVEEHHHQQATRIITAGLGRLIGGNPSDRWAFTIKGAAQLATGMLKSMFSTSNQSELTKTRASELGTIGSSSSKYQESQQS